MTVLVRLGAADVVGPAWDELVIEALGLRADVVAESLGFGEQLGPSRRLSQRISGR